jgi:hypothetical protein
VSRDSSDDEELMPEEILEGLTLNSREIYSGEELAEFLEEWADRDGFAEDLEYVAESTKLDNVPPEEVFEHLASTGQDYSVEEMVEMAESWSGQEWENYPEVSGTGDLRQPFFVEKFSVPRENYFIPLSGNYIGEADFSGNGKDVWLQEHETGWFQTEVKPLDKEELVTLFNSLERMSPAEYLHEVDYEGVSYFIDSEDFNYFFEFEDEVFEGDMYRIESNFGDFFFEASKLPKKNQYRAIVFSREGDRYPLEAYSDIFGEKLVKGMKTRLEL